MQVSINVDSTALLLRMRNGEKRLAYAVVNAINSTAKRIQEAERRQVESEFTVRKKEFIRRQAAIIKPFASVKQGRAYAEVAVGTKPRLLLSAFERGFVRTPHTEGARRIAVPVTGGAARPQFDQPVPVEFTFRRLRLKKDTKRGGKRKATNVTFRQTKKGQWKGAQRTFILLQTAQAPLGGVFQRIGPGKGDIRMIYSFKPPHKVDARLEFVETAEKEAQLWFGEEMEREVVKALTHDRGRSL